MVVSFWSSFRLGSSFSLEVAKVVYKGNSIVQCLAVGHTATDKL